MGVGCSATTATINGSHQHRSSVRAICDSNRGRALRSGIPAYRMIWGWGWGWGWGKARPEQFCLRSAAICWERGGTPGRVLQEPPRGLSLMLKEL